MFWKKNKKEVSPETLSNRNARRRIRTAEVIAALIPFGFMAFFGGKYLVLPQVNAEYSSRKTSIIYDEVSSYAVEGDYYDRSGTPLLSNASAGVLGTAEYPLNYSCAFLLGYYRTDGNTDYRYGLRGNLVNASMLTLDSSNKGASVYLTIDADLQNYAYSLLNGLEGSITVIDSDTGAILALASQSITDFDVNDPETFLASASSDAIFRRGTYETDPPGSTFKTVTAAAALKKQKDEGLDDSFFDYYDSGTYTAPGDTWEITNYGDAAYGQVDLDTAMADSINCYFANLGVEVGADALRETAEAFMIGKDIEIPYLCTLHSNLDISSDNLGLLAQTAFGQGNTQITPVHLALIASAISNDGIMMQPYIVDRITSGTRDIYNAQTKSLSTCMDSDVDARLKQAMHAAALTYGFSEANYGMVYAKTGTAECSNGRVHSYMIGCTDSYAFCVSFNTMASSGDLYDEALNLAAYLNANGF